MTVRLKLALTVFATGIVTALLVLITVVYAFQRFEHETAYRRGSALSAIEARPSRLNGVRRLLDVVFSFTNRQTDVTDKSCVRVDVSEEFPFLVSKIAPYFDH